MEELKKYINFEAVKKMTFKEFEKTCGKHPKVVRAGGAEKVYKMIKPSKEKE